ncbi:MAG: GntR family transcriptional regulator [Oscillospiraceae bacterium]
MSADFSMPNLGGNLMSTQVSSLLIKALKEGEYSTCERLPAEVDLAVRLGVSRTVIRDALSDLEREGFIERVRGIGTVINRNIVGLDNRLDLKFEYNELIKNAGYRPHTDNVRTRIELADSTLSFQLEVDVGSPIVVCEKRILANDRPVIYSVDYIAMELFGNRDINGIDWSRPVFDILDKDCGAMVTSNITHVSATNGDPAVREKLALSSYEALLLMDEISYSKLCRPVMRSLSYYTDFFDFTMLRKKF